MGIQYTPHDRNHCLRGFIWFLNCTPPALQPIMYLSFCFREKLRPLHLSFPFSTFPREDPEKEGPFQERPQGPMVLFRKGHFCRTTPDNPRTKWTHKHGTIMRSTNWKRTHATTRTRALGRSIKQMTQIMENGVRPDEDSTCTANEMLHKAHNTLSRLLCKLSEMLHRRWALMTHTKGWS